MWNGAAGRSSDRRGWQPSGFALGTKRLAPRHRWLPSGSCALGLATGVRGRSGARVPFSFLRRITISWERQ